MDLGQLDNAMDFPHSYLQLAPEHAYAFVAW
jgi:hypothetical protein